MKNQRVSDLVPGSLRGLFASGATLLSMLTIFLSATLASSVSRDQGYEEQDTTTPNIDNTNATEQSSSCYEEVKMVFVKSSNILEAFNSSSVTHNAGLTPLMNIMQGIMDGTVVFNTYQELIDFCENLTHKEAENASICHSPLPNFTSSNAISVITYSCLLVVAACGNLTVFITLFRNRGHKSRINRFIMHLAIADLIVTFIILPLEIAWHSTVSWWAGDFACRVLMFFRAMGFYLSSCIVVSISLDRYLAIMRPFSIAAADTRAKLMLVISWTLSIIASIPQSVIFHVERHPTFRWFTQCVTFNFFPTPNHELAYNLFSIIALYGLPLFIITFAYCVILCRISKKSRQSKGEVSARVFSDNGSDHGRLRRSGIGNIERAKSRTLKMTCVIVGAYVVCWTPYFVISAWYYFDRESARKVPSKVQNGLFICAVSNSCINPIVYGMFTIKFKRELIRCCYCLQGALRRRRQEDSYALRKSLLFPWKRNSESSSSLRNEQRLMKLGRAQSGDTTGQTAPTQGCRYSFVSPLTDVKASASRASLSSVGREERVSFIGHGREERVSFGTVMLGVPNRMDRPGLTSSFSASRDDRANLNNFVRLGSGE